MRKINNRTDLIRERELLLIRKEQLEQEIAVTVDHIRQDLQPLNLMREGVSHLFSANGSGIISQSVGGVIAMLLRKVILRKSGWISRLVLPFIAKNATANLVSDHKDAIIGSISDFVISLFKRKPKKQEQPAYDTTTAGEDIY